MPSAFTGPIRLEHLDANWQQWKLLEPLRWEVDKLGSKQFIDVPTGFVTDGATVPRLLWWLMPMTGSYLRAACLHDYLYTLVNSEKPHRFAKTKKRADRQFLLAMKATGVNILVRRVMYLAVCLFGAPAK